MRIPLLLTFAATLAVASARSQEVPETLVFVQGGTFKNPNSNFHEKGVTLSDFYIGAYEVTQKEWVAVMGSNPSNFRGDDLPVEMVSWYDSIEFCNKRSIKEGLEPYYRIAKGIPDARNESDHDDVKWTVTINTSSNGYRLPTEAEWEYAASGGQQSTGYAYSGSAEIEDVAWYWQNSGDEPLLGLWNWPLIENNRNQTKAVGGKKPNELGLFDMSGNVREWCWDWYGDLASNLTDDLKGSPRGAVRVWKGGGWLAGDFTCELSFRGNFEPHSMGFDHGFRVARNP